MSYHRMTEHWAWEPPSVLSNCHCETDLNEAYLYFLILLLVHNDSLTQYVLSTCSIFINAS